MMDDLSSASSYATSTWVSWFLSAKGNEYFCEVDEDYILDRFNLTGLNAEVQHYPQALDLVTDAMEEEMDQETRDHIEAQGRLLYGLVHARYIITSRGLAKMLEKYKRSDFGRCPRVLCYSQPLLPLGLSDLPFQKAVKLFCPRCEDIYSPKSSRHGTIDGAFFGSSFPHLLFMVYPHMLPSKSPSSQSPFLLPPPSNHSNQQQQQHGAAAGPSGARSAPRSRSGTGEGGSGSLAVEEDGGEASPMSVDQRSQGSASAERNNGNNMALSAGGSSGGPSSGSTQPPGTASGQQGTGSVLTSPSQHSNQASSGPTAMSGPPIHKGVERYKPRIFGFPVHEVAVLHRWQERVAEQMQVNVGAGLTSTTAGISIGIGGGGGGGVSSNGNGGGQQAAQQRGAGGGSGPHQDVPVAGRR